MSQPFIFVSTHRLKEGQREAYRNYCADFVKYIEARNPHLRVFQFSFDEDGDHVNVVQVHDDPASMTTHMRLAQDHIGESYAQYLDETVSMQIFGDPTDDVIAMMEQLAGGGVPVSINRPFDGLDRLSETIPTA